MNTARLDISDPALKEAVANVRSDSTDAKYCIFNYEGKAKIKVKEVGSGSMADMAEELDDGEVSFVLLRVEGGRDQESKAVKFCYIVFVGSAVGGMAKGRVSSHKMDLKVHTPSPNQRAHAHAPLAGMRQTPDTWSEAPSLRLRCASFLLRLLPLSSPRRVSSIPAGKSPRHPWHRPPLFRCDSQEIIGWTVVDIQTDDKDDLKEEIIREKLKKASGANYDLGSNAGGTYESKAGDIGKSAAAKYKELEKQSNIGPVAPTYRRPHSSAFMTPRLALRALPALAPSPSRAKALRQVAPRHPVYDAPCAQVAFEKFARPKETPMDLGGRCAPASPPSSPPFLASTLSPRLSSHMSPPPPFLSSPPHPLSSPQADGRTAHRRQGEHRRARRGGGRQDEGARLEDG